MKKDILFLQPKVECFLRVFLIKNYNKKLITIHWIFDELNCCHSSCDRAILSAFSKVKNQPEKNNRF